MKERVWVLDSKFSKFLYAWVTCFGIFNSPRDVCATIRNMIIGTPVMLALGSFISVFILLMLFSMVAVPAYGILGPDTMSFAQVLGYTNNVCSSVYSEAASIARCVQTQEVYASLTSYETFIVKVVPIGIAIWLITIVALLFSAVIKIPTLARAMTPKIMKESTIWADLKEAHKDKLCFRVEWKDEKGNKKY